MLSVFGVAQNDINSPYSGYGIGNISPRTNIVTSAMGGVGYALQSPYYINFKNPAAFAAFDSLSFIGDLAFSLINQNLRNQNQSQGGTIAHLDYLTIGLPILKVWRSSAGIVPYSDVGFDMVDTYSKDTIGNIHNRYQGSGGLMLLYWGNAFKICKGLTLGINWSYLFGTINKTNFAEYDSEFFFNSVISNFHHYDGIQISGGIQYNATINEKHQLGIGAVYENNLKVWSKENLLVLNYYGTYNPNPSTSAFDTIKSLTGKNTVKMPQTIGGGISYEYQSKLVAALDVTWQNWKKYAVNNSKDSLKMKNNLIAAVGIQYVPNALSSKYYNKINFRAGTRFSTGYVILNSHPISEFAVTVGLGLPFRTLTSRSSINLMFEYSRLGTLKNDLILQNCYKLTINLILQEKWYQRRKLE